MYLECEKESFHLSVKFFFILKLTVDVSSLTHELAQLAPMDSGVIPYNPYPLLHMSTYSPCPFGST